jgi:hypothetical protein
MSAIAVAIALTVLAAGAVIAGMAFVYWLTHVDDYYSK